MMREMVRRRRGGEEDEVGRDGEREERVGGGKGEDTRISMA